MKNLFEYAKKELTQDAVIAWLLESGNIGKALLLNMCPQLKNDIQENGTEIEELVVNTQTESIDILVEVKLSNGKTTAVIIEDKTDTYLHDFQMLKYIANTANKNENRSKFFAEYESKAIEKNITEKTDLKSLRKMIIRITYYTGIFKLIKMIKTKRYKKNA